MLHRELAIRNGNDLSYNCYFLQTIIEAVCFVPLDHLNKIAIFKCSLECLNHTDVTIAYM